MKFILLIIFLISINLINCEKITLITTIDNNYPFELVINYEQYNEDSSFIISYTPFINPCLLNTMIVFSKNLRNYKFLHNGRETLYLYFMENINLQKISKLTYSENKINNLSYTFNYNVTILHLLTSILMIIIICIIILFVIAYIIFEKYNLLKYYNSYSKQNNINSEVN
jgi:hypothetical protein